MVSPDLVQILVVEDDAGIRLVLEITLKAAGYTHVKSVGRGDEALDWVRRQKPDLVILDVMLPGVDGFSVCRRIREAPELMGTRILMLTARVQADDVVQGLELGADDYVTKPFDRRVLLARIQSVLRRGAPRLPETEMDGLCVNEATHEATLSGEALRLSPGEFRILSLLLSHRDRVLSRAQILDVILSDDKAVTERTVDVQMVGLRRKLGPWASHIETVRGIGYRVRL